MSQPISTSSRINLIVGQHLTTGIVDGEAVAVTWQARGAWYVASAGEEPAAFLTENDATDAFYSALIAASERPTPAPLPASVSDRPIPALTATPAAPSSLRVWNRREALAMSRKVRQLRNHSAGCLCRGHVGVLASIGAAPALSPALPTERS